MSVRGFGSTFLWASVLVSGGMGAVHAALPLDPSTVSLQLSVRIPMRDGVNLGAMLYRPSVAAAAAPCLFTMTPYTADSVHASAKYFAANGYSFLSVDSRGRGESEGEFRPFAQDGQDGYDVVEWLARQSYCNGKVAMWGLSYMGFNQWATAKELPPHLATIVPVAAPFMGVDLPMRNNVPTPYLIQWLTLTRGHAAQDKIFGDDALWANVWRKWFESGRSFRDLDEVFGEKSPIFQDWVSHPEPDAYWDASNPTAEQYARLQIPILSVTGSNDLDQPGALEHYKNYMRNASPEGRARHYLIIGPWDHGGTMWPRDSAGGVKFGPAAVVDMRGLQLQWYRWTLQGGPKPEFLRKPVAFYVMGADRWRYANTLEEVTARAQTYFLDSAANANGLFSAGSLGSDTPKGRPDWYVYDPREVSGPEVDATAPSDGTSLVDQSVVVALSGRELVYHSAPFPQDTEVSGFFKLSAWIAIDTPDTDLFVSVFDIGADGSSIRLSTDILRARYREGLRTPKLIQTRAPLRYDFERFSFVSRQIRRGHRLRLVIAPMGPVILEKNYNVGGVVAEETSKVAQPVTVRLFHDKSHPSALYVPIGQIND